jgi:hypothetical protein
MLVFAGVAVYGFVVSLGGQALFKEPFLDLDRDEPRAPGTAVR